MIQLLLKKRLLQNINYKIAFDKITCQFFQSSVSKNSLQISVGSFV